MNFIKKVLWSVVSLMAFSSFMLGGNGIVNAFAEDVLTMNTIFSDHMVLQREKKVEIYGETNAGTLVKVSFKGQEKTCMADSNGAFSVYLDAMQADAVGSTLTVEAGSMTQSFSDVLVGEVYYGSGQSNMAYPFDEHTYAENVIKRDPSYGVDYEKYNNQPSYLEDYNQYEKWHLLRFYMQKMLPETGGVKNKGVQNTWLDIEGVADLKYVSVTAVAYAIHLSQKLGDIPVGVAVAAVGGSRVHEWISDESAAKIFPNSANTTLSQRYNNMVLPMGRFTLRGILWYQGESDVYSDLETYRSCFVAWAKDMRTFFKDENLPIITFQLPQYEDDGCKDLWAAFRQLQEEITQQNENVYYVCGIDLGDHRNIHPLQKWEFCERAAGLALKYIYNVEYSGAGSYGQNPTISNLYRKTGSQTVYMRFENASTISVSEGVERGLLATTNKQYYTNISSFTLVDSTTIAFTTKLKYISYLQNNIFDYDTAFIYNEYGLPVAPFVEKEVSVYDYDVTLELEGCTTDGYERYFAIAGEDVAFKIIPNEGYELELFTINGEEQEFADGAVSLSNITSDVAIVCKFRTVNTPPDESGTSSDNQGDSGNHNSGGDVVNSDKENGGGCNGTITGSLFGTIVLTLTIPAIVLKRKKEI